MTGLPESTLRSVSHSPSGNSGICPNAGPASAAPCPALNSAVAGMRFALAANSANLRVTLAANADFTELHNFFRSL